MTMSYIKLFMQFVRAMLCFCQLRVIFLNYLGHCDKSNASLYRLLISTYGSLEMEKH